MTRQMTAPSSSKNTQGKACRNLIGRLPDFKGHLLFWPIAIAGAAFDLWSKKAVFDWLPTVIGEKYVIIDGFFQFILRENSGAAFSILQGQKLFLVGILIVAFFVVIGVFLLNGVNRRTTQVALAFFTGGIVGNFYDRAFNNGLVRDFLDVYVRDYHWPTFNVADSLLCIGVGLLVISNLFSAQTERENSSAK
jgi:signal peptidase II